MKKQKIFFLQLVVNVAVFALLIFGGSALALVIPSDIDPNHPIPGNEPITLPEARSIIGAIGGFLVIIAPIILIISLILAAITYMSGGASPEAVKRAKSWFGNAVIGAFIIFGAGVIINTIAAVVSRNFFCQVGIGGICIF